MRYFDLSILLVSLLPGACATSDCRPPLGSPSLTPSAVTAASPHVGALVRWGGVLIEARHHRDSTEVEVVAYPLDDCGRPRTGSGSLGRFIVVHPGFLETTDYRAGQEISAAGRITGIRKGLVGGATYSFPLLESYKIHPWPARDRRGNGGYSSPWVNLGIGGGSGGVLGGVSVVF